MSIASNLQTLASNLSSILSAINVKLIAKGSTSADTLDDVAGKINAIPSGGITPSGTIAITTNDTHDVTNYKYADVHVINGGTPVVRFKNTGVSTSRTDATEISFSGLDVDSGETLIGVHLAHQGTPSANTTAINTLYVIPDGDGWKFLRADAINGNALVVAQISQMTFEKSGETGGTITSSNPISLFLDGTYLVWPIVGTVE